MTRTLAAAARSERRGRKEGVLCRRGGGAFGGSKDVGRRSEGPLRSVDGRVGAGRSAGDDVRRRERRRMLVPDYESEDGRMRPWAGLRRRRRRQRRGGGRPARGGPRLRATRGYGRRPRDRARSIVGAPGSANRLVGSGGAGGGGGRRRRRRSPRGQAPFTRSTCATRTTTRTSSGRTTGAAPRRRQRRLGRGRLEVSVLTSDAGRARSPPRSPRPARSSPRPTRASSRRRRRRGVPPVPCSFRVDLLDPSPRALRAAAASLVPPLALGELMRVRPGLARAALTSMNDVNTDAGSVGVPGYVRRGVGGAHAVARAG